MNYPKKCSMLLSPSFLEIVQANKHRFSKILLLAIRTQAEVLSVMNEFPYSNPLKIKGLTVGHPAYDNLIKASNDCHRISTEFMAFLFKKSYITSCHNFYKKGEKGHFFQIEIDIAEDRTPWVSTAYFSQSKDFAQ